MLTAKPFQFVRQFHYGNDTITESHCSQCGVLVGGATEDKYLAIAEAAHKCLMRGTPHVQNVS